MIRTPSKVMMVSSSPGRAEKLPAPMLTTLLRGKGGSRSRGRTSSASISRSSPMFTARRRTASADIQEEKEPSSPKVTCIGQVRISKKKSSASASSSSSSLRSKQEQQQKQGGCVPRGCSRCFRRGFFCNPFSKGFGVKFNPSSASPYGHHDPARGWRKWFLLPRSGCYRQRKPPRQRQQHQQRQKEEPPRMPTGIQAAVAGSDDEGDRSEQGEVEDDDGDDEGETKVFVPTTPPKNALLLMRCRSAPHRAACVPDRFWAAESDSAAGSTAAAAPGGTEPSRGENRGGEEPINDCSVSTYEARAGITTDGAGAGAGDSREGEDDDGEAAAVGPSPSFSSRPLILTRCKSEPARTAAKLAAPDASYCFWNSGSNQSSKPWSKNSSSNINNKRWLTLLGEARPIPSQ